MNPRPGWTKRVGLRAACVAAMIALCGRASAADPISAAKQLLEIHQFGRTGEGNYSLALAERLRTVADSLDEIGADTLSWRCRRAAAAHFSRRGRGEEAIRENERALETATRLRADRLILITRIALGDSYRSVGWVEEAIEVARNAVETAAAAGDSGGVAEASNSVAASCLAVGRMNEAGEAFVRSLNAARSIGDMPNTIEAISGLTQYLHFCERNQEALAYADSAVALADVRASAHRRAVAYNIRAIIRSAVGRSGDALVDADSACAIDRRSGNTRHLIESRLTRARTLLQMGARDSCIAEVDRLLELAAQREGDVRTRLLSLKGVALIEDGRLAEAESLLIETVARTEARRLELQDENSRAAAFYYGGVAYNTLSRCYLEQGKPRDAWRALQAGRAGALRARLSLPGGPEPEDRIDRLQARLSTAKAAILHYNDPARNPPMVFVLSGDSLRVVRLPEPHGAASAQTAMQLLSSGADEGLCRAALEPLSRNLLTGVLDAIPLRIERLYIAPPSGLVGLPFEELPIPGSRGQVLLDRFAVSYLPNADVLLDLLDRDCGIGGMLLVADPEPLPEPEKGPLPGAREEARRIAIRGSTVLAGKSATRARLLDRLASRPPTTIHFATHATVDAVNPGRSSLLLADGAVTAAEVESLTISADLVTLSGCRTSGGFVYLGEGTLGLTRSFLIAGARSVVSSLWDVEDRAATRIMERFYEGLRDGLPRDQALRQAKLAMRREEVLLRDRAAFVLTGAGDRPVPGIAGAPLRRPPWAYILAIGAGMAALATAAGLLRRGAGKSPHGRSLS